MSRRQSPGSTLLPMLRFPLTHPPLLAALGAAGHGSTVLIADANYPHSTGISPGAQLVHLNLRPGLLQVDQVLEPVLAAIPVESATVMQPADGSVPAVFGRYRELLGEDVQISGLERMAFYAACREPSLAVCVATGDERLYANLLLTIGVVHP